MDSATVPNPTSPPVEFATKAEVDALAARVDALEQKGTQVPGGAPEPANEGENLERTPGSPELDPHQPGVEPGASTGMEPTPAPNAPASTDPLGDTAKQNAPEAPAPDPGGPNVATNPGTESGSDAQTEVPGGGSSAPQGETTATGEPQPTIPAEDASEKPLYVDVTADRSATWSYTPAFTLAGLQTPDGRPLYHWEGDEDGKPAAGAKDGTIGVYADEVVVPTPANSEENADGSTPAEGASA